MARMLFILMLLPRLAAAQTVIDHAGSMTVGSWSQPRLNSASCGSNDNIVITLTNPMTMNSSSETLYVWWDEGSCGAGTAIVTDSSDPNFFGSTGLQSGGKLMTTQPFTFATDMDAPKVLTKNDVLVHLDACNVPTATRYLKLCFDIDLPDSQNRLGYIETSEPYAWIQFKVDTLAPPAPEVPGVTSLDGALEFNARVTATGDTTDIAKWRARIRKQPTDPLLQGTACSTWTAAEIDGDETIDAAGTSADIQVSATNLVTYEGCVSAIDSSGNEGPASPIATGMPVPACDFIECYPGELETGFCGATAAPLWAGAATGLLLRLKRRKSRRQAAP